MGTLIFIFFITNKLKSLTYISEMYRIKASSLKFR